MAEISLAKVCELVNAGGWKAVCSRKFGPSGLPALGMVVMGGTVVVDIDREPYEVNNDRLTCDAEMTADGRPYSIQVRGPVSIQQQHKKADGGGHYTVERPSLRLRFVHEIVLAEHDEARRQKWERIMDEAIAREKEEEERGARITAFIARQKQLIGSAYVQDLNTTPNGLLIWFDNGHMLTIEPGDGDTWAIIGGDYEKISLRDGKAPRY